MNIIEPHIHMIARTTQDYERMARMHCVACCEPAFWAGYDRTSAAAFYDYFTHLTEFEPRRAKNYLIEHYAWICLNPKEADDRGLTREVLAFMPEFLAKPNVLGVGEIGLNKNTQNELEAFNLQVDLAVKLNQLIWIHTPHLNDKKKGVQMLLAALRERSDINPARVCFDHLEEHVVKAVLDAGFWGAMTIYPQTKNSAERVVDTLEIYGTQNLMVDASGDWGPSDPATLHNAVFIMRQRGHPPHTVENVFYNNPCRFLGQSPKFKFTPTN